MAEARWKIKNRGPNWAVWSNADAPIVEGPDAGEWITVVPESRALAAERRVEELESQLQEEAQAS